MLLRLVAIALVLMGSALLAGTARADSATTRDALDRLDEILELRLEDGHLKRDDLVPAILVSAEPRYADSEDWYAARVIEVLHRSLGSSGLRVCEACMAPRAWVGDGALTWQTGPISLDEIVRLDDRSRGSSAPARAAIWVDEFRGGVSIRIVDLRSARVIFAQNVDPHLVENANSHRMYTMSEELERRARGDSITQAFVDAVAWPGQHVSFDWTDQWGETNANLSGVTISLFDPVVGLGAAHYRCVSPARILVGGKLVLSLPTAVARSIDDSVEVIDPIVTGVAVVRVPFGRSNYGAVASASTNGQVGIGISLMNISLLPVLP